MLAYQKKWIIACLLVSAVPNSIAFTSPSTSTFCIRASHELNIPKRGVSKPSPRQSTELNMMFDQLSAALTEVAQNFGGKQR